MVSVSRTICPFYCHPDRRAQALCHPDRAKRAEGSALHVIPTERSEWRDLSCRLHCHKKRNGKTLMLSKMHSLTFPFLFSVLRCRPERSYVVLSAAERPAALALLRSKKRNGKTLMLIKTHSLPFPFLFSVQRCHPERQPRDLLFLSPQAYFLSERQSRGLLTEADSPASVLRTYARNDIAPFLQKISEKAKTVGKRNSFPGFSFFECPSFALFIFLSCGDADVSSAFGLVGLFWFVFLFIFAYE